ncbi:MAG TPA: VOC family protein [Rhizomicrobium sp.]|nr:VOC family protein [Rhizomicrobium sp.]
MRLPDYVEFVVKDAARSKAFYSAIFGWPFTDYGPDYTSFEGPCVSGGFTTDGTPRPGGPLMVFAVDDIETVFAKAKAAGAAITKEIFTFPGGRRFQFTDPDGYEIAAWTE